MGVRGGGKEYGVSEMEGSVRRGRTREEGKTNRQELTRHEGEGRGMLWKDRRHRLHRGQGCPGKKRRLPGEEGRRDMR